MSLMYNLILNINQDEIIGIANLPGLYREIWKLEAVFLHYNHNYNFMKSGINVKY